MTIRIFVSRRGLCTALALVSAVLVLTLPASDSLRAIAGLLLAGPLLAWSVDRLVLGRSHERPRAEIRWSIAVGFALIGVLGVGLVLAVTPIDLKVSPLAVGLVLVIAACDLSSQSPAPESGPRRSPRIGPWALALVGVGVGVTAFVVARHSAVSASRRQATAYVYLLQRVGSYEAVLANSTNSAQRFVVTVDRSGARAVHLTRTLGPQKQLRVPIANTGRKGRKGFTLTASVVAGPQDGLTLHLTAPAAG